MKKLVLLFSLLCAVLVVPTTHAADDQTELGEHMEKIGGAFRKLGRQIKDPAQNDASIKLVETIHSHAVEAAKLKPDWAKEFQGDKLDKFMADYNEQMKTFVTDIETLETDLKAGKNDAAAADMKKLKGDMDQGHKEFRKPKPKKKQQD